jgi:hypothetical protein
MLHHDDSVSPLARVAPKAQRHLECYLDAGRTAVREEYVRERLGR